MAAHAVALEEALVVARGRDRHVFERQHGHHLAGPARVTDADGPGPYSFIFTQAPQHGSLSTIGSDGSVIYTPQSGFEGTDTAAVLAEHGDVDVAAVPGSPANLKITFPEDVALAERLVQLL